MAASGRRKCPSTVEASSPSSSSNRPLLHDPLFRNLRSALLQLGTNDHNPSWPSHRIPRVISFPLLFLLPLASFSQRLLHRDVCAFRRDPANCRYSAILFSWIDADRCCAHIASLVRGQSSLKSEWRAVTIYVSRDFCYSSFGNLVKCKYRVGTISRSIFKRGWKDCGEKSMARNDVCHLLSNLHIHGFIVIIKFVHQYTFRSLFLISEMINSDNIFHLFEIKSNDDVDASNFPIWNNLDDLNSIFPASNFKKKFLPPCRWYENEPRSIIFNIRIPSEAFRCFESCKRSAARIHDSRETVRGSGKEGGSPVFRESRGRKKAEERTREPREEGRGVVRRQQRAA